MDPILAWILWWLGTSYGVGVTSTITAGALVALASRAPRTVRWARRKVLGSRLLVLGPSGAGKSSFLNYLKNGKFADRSEVPKTSVVQDVDGFLWEGGTEHPLSVSAATDVPGELNVTKQAGLAVEKRPDAIIIVVTSQVEPATDWVQRFCSELSSALMLNKDLRKALRSLTIVLNKRDELIDESQWDTVKKKVEIIAHSQLKPVLGENTGRVTVNMCTLLERAGAEKAAGAVALHVALSLRHKTPLVRP